MFEGIFTPIVTPFTAHEEVDYEKMYHNLDESPVPIFVYNMPGNTGINLPSSLVANLSQHPNIVGIKDTSGNIVQIPELVRDTDGDFSVFAGMLQINSIVTAKLGIPALKFALDMLGYQGGQPRRPLRPLSEEARQTVRDALVKYGAL